MNISDLGKLLIFLGLAVAGVGFLLIAVGKIHIPWLGRLPGDFYIRGKNLSFYFPLTTSLLISALITLILWFIHRK